MNSEIIEVKDYHSNGELNLVTYWQIAPEMFKQLYDYRTGLKGYEGIPVYRVGTMTKYYDNGQFGWSLKYDGYGHVVKENTAQCRKDGIGIRY